MRCCYFWIQNFRTVRKSLTGRGRQWSSAREPAWTPKIASLFLGLSFLILSSTSLIAAPDFAKIRQAGLERFNARDFEGALPYFDRAYELQAYNDDIRFRLAICLIYRNPGSDPEKYHSDLLRAISLLKDSVEAQERIEIRSHATGLRHFHLAMAYWYAGRGDLALDSFRRSFRSDFTRTDALYNRIVLFRQLGKIKEAEVAAAEYIRLTSIESIDD